MDREKLLRHLEQRYTPRRDILSRIPLGVQADALWEELLSRRRGGSTVLPLYNGKGLPYWFVTTEKMIAASEKIVETLLENDTGFDPYTDVPNVSTLEEVFFTGYVDGAQISMQDAMGFITEERQPHDIEEQLLSNNRVAGSYAGANLYRPVDESFLKELITILTENMDQGGSDYRENDSIDSHILYEEGYSVPAPQALPLRVKELCAFLAAPQIHPLIKAGVAQVYLIAAHPFNEGNERLGRLLSSIVLLRAGYTFFSDVSLSALIARKSYGYYDAIANSLREENGSDLTYFLEYFLELLSRAIDERQLRMAKNIQESLLQEQALAQTPLTGFTPSPPTPPERGPERPDEPPAKEAAADDDGFTLDSFQTVSIDGENETTHEPVSLTPMEQLKRDAQNPATPCGMLAEHLLKRHKTGRIPFYAGEVATELKNNGPNISKILRRYEKKGVLEFDHLDGVRRYYRLASDQKGANETSLANCSAPEVETEHEYSSSVMDLINRLSLSNSPKDNRVARMLRYCQPSGEITIEAYMSCNEESKWAYDMAFATQLGLVKRIDARRFVLLRDLNTDPAVLTSGQRKVLTEIYDSFGSSDFSSEMVIATLDYSGSLVCAYLHQFTLLKILDCRKEGVFRYRFLINPEDHPGYFVDAA